MTEIDLTLLGKVLISLQDDVIVDPDTTHSTANKGNTISLETSSFGSIAVPAHIDVSLVSRPRFG